MTSAVYPLCCDNVSNHCVVTRCLRPERCRASRSHFSPFKQPFHHRISAEVQAGSQFRPRTMFSKTARPCDASAVPPAKRLRRNLVDLYASNELSATRAQELIDDAADAGVEDCQSLRRRNRATTTSKKKNCARDLRARLLRGCRWPRTYEAQIRT